MTFVYIKPITWTQSIRRYPTINVNGLYLNTQCTTDSDLTLSDKLKLRDLKLHLSIMQGELSEENRGKAKLSEGAIGGIWWGSEDNLVHGWLYLPNEDYAAVWEQIKGGDYIDCEITLGIASESVESTGGDCAWKDKDKPISLDSGEVSFKRKAIEEDEKEDSKTRPIGTWPVAGSNRYWAVILILMAATAWYLPHWNGSFFGPVTDLTAGEARIASTIMLVGGLLLWFMRVP